MNTYILRSDFEFHKIAKLRFRTKSGFALVVTLSLMVLLLILALGMLSISSVELRAAGHNKSLHEARSNARMALMLAIGELQKTLGPDQRVSAPANINPTNTTQPNLVGVWNSFSLANGDSTAIDYSSQKDSDFLQWLCSASSSQKTDSNYPAQEPPNSVKLVDSGSVSPTSASSGASNYISASTVDVVDSSGNATGKYAWCVMDESQKMQLTLNAPAVGTAAEKMAAMGTAGKPGFSIDSSYDTLENMTDENRSKLISLRSTEIVPFDQLASGALSYLTTDSKNLLVDVVNGGLQTDLSLLLENDELPEEYTDRYIYSGTNTPVEPAPTRFDGAEPMPSPDPKWSFLHSHYQLYKDFDPNISTYSLAASENERSEASGYFDKQQILPVVSNAQLVFSTAPANRSGTDYLYLWTDIYISLWNPYDVEITVTPMEFELYRLPLQLELFRKRAGETAARSVNGRKAHYGDMYAGNPFRARITQPFTMQPGEYKIFGSDTYTIHWGNRYYKHGLELTEKWDLRAGGVEVQDNAFGTGYQRVEPGDVYTLDVDAARVDRGTGFDETNNEEVVCYMKIFQQDAGKSNYSTFEDIRDDLDSRRTQIGAIEIDLPGTDADLAKFFPSYGHNEVPEQIIPYSALPPVGQSMHLKVPFLMAAIRLKTEADSQFTGGGSSSMWLHNGITNQYFSNGLKDDQDIDLKSHQYELSWKLMTSWESSPGIEYDPAAYKSYGGSGITSESGVFHAPFLQVPKAPATSIAQFSHAPINSGGMAPYTTQVIGNSFASPSIPIENKSNNGAIGKLIDHSYMANTALFDSYFLSTATTEEEQVFGSSSRDLDEVITEFLDGTQLLRNPNFEPAANQSINISTSDYDSFAQHIYNKGAFNVNSTSEEAWALFLASGTQESLPILDILTASKSLNSSAISSDFAFSRFNPMIGDNVNPDSNSNDQERWESHRRLTPDQILTLAKNVVLEVKARGPFQSIAEFVNRRLDSDTTTGNSGALQSAIEKSGINSTTNLVPAAKNSTELDSGGTGSTVDGAPSQLTQADILNRLAPSITVRGDTFKIRAYGEATANGQTSRVWCEAVVQRKHEFMDDSEAATTAIEDLQITTKNKEFGRRFEILSFRWLSDSEI